MPSINISEILLLSFTQYLSQKFCICSSVGLVAMNFLTLSSRFIFSPSRVNALDYVDYMHRITAHNSWIHVCCSLIPYSFAKIAFFLRRIQRCGFPLDIQYLRTDWTCWDRVEMINRYALFHHTQHKSNFLFASLTGSYSCDFLL